jgi:hypothetical protein
MLFILIYGPYYVVENWICGWLCSQSLVYLGDIYILPTRAVMQQTNPRQP